MTDNDMDPVGGIELSEIFDDRGRLITTEEIFTSELYRPTINPDEIPPPIMVDRRPTIGIGNLEVCVDICQMYVFMNERTHANVCSFVCMHLHVYSRPDHLDMRN